MKIETLPKILLASLVWIALSVTLIACDSDVPQEQYEAEGFLCVECHTVREELTASLEADPLPEEPPEESEGEC